MSDFDRERFEQLATKAQNNDLTADEVEELQEQIDEFQGIMHDFAGGLVDILSPAMEQFTNAFEPLAKFAEEQYDE